MDHNQPYQSIQNRLQELRGEYARGQAQMSALNRQQNELHETLLRISGAIQVLEELNREEAPNSTLPAASEGTVRVQAPVGEKAG